MVIEKVVRNKRKCITTVKGLELFGEHYAGLNCKFVISSPPLTQFLCLHSGVKLSDASKKLGKKFATGASVVKV